MDDPATRAEAMVDAYENNFVGRVGPAARSVASRFANTPGTDESLLGIRGPYLQALDIPNWSDRSWETFCRQEGINPLIQTAFSDLGFRRLYGFQERTVSRVQEGHDTVVTAATGRGKTEAWLIPILDRILDEKRNESDQGVKALLIYPTKALAQDQFKRLVQYLYRINEKWPSTDQITIGIYDGDTPRNVGSNAHGYLESSFKYFECPGRNEELEKCRTCGQGVRIHHAGQQYELQPEKRQCVDDVPLDFIRLTKNQILSEGVDILLTNPDTINRKLINVNASDEHKAFIYDPEFLVFDEVHTYDGLFGSFTATLTKRLRALRSRRECSDLQVIASSATVDNDVELFRKVSGAKSIKHVDEDPQELDPDSIDRIPDVLAEERLSESDLMAYARNQRTSTILSQVDFDIEPAEHDDERLRELLQDTLFDYFTSPTPDPVANAIQTLHHELSTDPRPRSELISFLESEFGLEPAAAELVLENFQTLGTFSGLLENRTHLFSWPIDGFYACASCDAVYRSPQESCSKCGFGFVTRSTYCRGCDDEALVAWYCPRCDQLDPYQPSDEGEQTFDDEHACQRCRQSRGESVRTLRVTFHPKLECQNCGSVGDRTPKQTCSECGTDMVHTEPETHACPNPACESTQSHQEGCTECGGEQRPVAGTGPIDCPNCGRTHSERTTCACGTEIIQTRFLPWVCRNDSCERTYFETPPDTCGCGSSHTFAKRGLFEVFEDTHCEECETAFVDERGCNCTENSRHREGAHQSFKTFEPNGALRTISSIPSVAPCRHGSLRYDPNRRYDELVRGPGNLAVTTAQYLLRDVAEDEGFESAKQLSFADSHRDMKELDRDFREPEVGTLLDQCIVETLQESSDPWVPLATVLDDAMAEIDALHETLAPPQDVQSLTFDLQEELVGTARRHMEPEAAIRDRLCRRSIPHKYSPRYHEFGGSLASVGIVDFRIDPEACEGLTRAELSVVETLVTTGNDIHVDDIDSGQVDDTADLVDDLEEAEILEVDDGYVRFNQDIIHLTVAGGDDELQYLPESGTIEHSVDAQLNTVSDAAVPFETSIAELADPSHPRFDARAFRALYSETRILLSRVYHGMTDKRERRELEYLFREGNYPHFLSSGPTMELGVDIGALDALLLYGTPPNMNAYLQRIGRAGRSSNTSLVHSVSQRNPIDYYYYDQPTDLMAADPQPVPLKEFNREVLRVSLTWAVFDYIAANFVIPWSVERHGRYISVSGGDTFHQRQPSPTDDTAKLTYVMSARTTALGLGSDHTQFDVLETIVHDHRSEIETYLESLLDYKFCPLCSRKYDRDDPIGRCQGDNCDGQIRDAVDTFDELVTEAVDEFAARYLYGYESYLEEIDTEITELDSETHQLKHEREQASSRREAQRLRREEEDLLDRKSALKQQKERIQDLSYVEFLRESRQSRYAFDMRTIDESVAVSLVDSDGDGYTTRTIGDDDGRSIRMAISELHPQAAYLDSGDTYVVSHLSTDDFKSSELRERVRNAAVDTLAEQYVCPACKRRFDTAEEDCECDTDTSLTRLRLASPESVTAHRSDLILSNGDLPAREMYAQSDAEIQNTYADREMDVLQFEPAETYTIRSKSGEVVGSLEYGSFTVLVHASSYRAKYKNGEIDPEPTPFEVCGDPDCTGVIYYDDQEEPHCSADSSHAPSGEEGSEFVRLGYAYETEGVRVDIGETEQSHVFAHGLRLALQYLGGVSIRDISEVVHDGSMSAVDVFDSQEGGAGIARLLVSDTDGENFQRALELMREHLECDCADGCPLCLYQYGCDTRNQGESFDLSQVVELLEQTEITLNTGETEPPSK